MKLLKGDNIELLKGLEENSIDSVVTDPPYGLKFMNKKWDHDVPTVEFWEEVYRVLKPGGHVLSFGGTRTYHRMVVNIEDAGFEIRDQIQWLYGSGFPKSHNIGKVYDKKMGNDREVVKEEKATGTARRRGGIGAETVNGEYEIVNEYIVTTKGTSPYEGWGTALKPANEPICLARKPFKGSVVDNVIKWGTGGINVDGCRVVANDIGYTERNSGVCYDYTPTILSDGEKNVSGHKQNIVVTNANGRFPANIILDEQSSEMLDKQSGYLKSGEVKPHHKKNKTAGGYQGNCYGKYKNEDTTLKGYGDGGGASRFFYCAKVSKRERNLGLDNYTSNHPTVKPVSLMRYLCRLITPVNGTVLDPFMGSGSTGIAARLEGFNFVGMEMDDDYYDIATARINSFEEYRKTTK